MPTADELMASYLEALSDSDLELMVQQLGSNPFLLEMSKNLPPKLQENLDAVPKDRLMGYLLGVMRSAQAFDAMSQLASRGDAKTAELIQLRLDTITYVVCKKLTDDAPRLILLH